MTDIYTSQYKYKGLDRLDITVKGQDPLGRWFAPTWDMVMGYKNGIISESEYKRLYNNILVKIPTYIWTELTKRERITLVCFCKPNTFCHRVLLANYMNGTKFTYKGEI